MWITHSTGGIKYSGAQHSDTNSSQLPPQITTPLYNPRQRLSSHQPLSSAKTNVCILIKPDKKIKIKSSSNIYTKDSAKNKNGSLLIQAFRHERLGGSAWTFRHLAGRYKQISRLVLEDARCARQVAIFRWNLCLTSEAGDGISERGPADLIWPLGWDLLA